MQYAFAAHLHPYLSGYRNRVPSSALEVQPDITRASPNPSTSMNGHHIERTPAHFKEMQTSDGTWTVLVREAHLPVDPMPDSLDESRSNFLAMDADEMEVSQQLQLLSQETELSQSAENGEGSEPFESDSEPSQTAAEILTELKEKAKRVRQEAYRKWKRETKNKTPTKFGHVTLRSMSQQFRAPAASTAQINPGATLTCTARGCTFRGAVYALAQHVHTHYPDAYFCPVCECTVRTRSALRAHLARVPIPRKQARRGKGKGKGKTCSKSGSGSARDGNEGGDEGLGVGEDEGGDDDMKGEREAESEACAASADALRYEVARDPERFNLYWLGVMEKYAMPDTHFEMIAGRRRGEKPC